MDPWAIHYHRVITWLCVAKRLKKWINRDVSKKIAKYLYVDKIDLSEIMWDGMYIRLRADTFVWYPIHQYGCTVCLRPTTKLNTCRKHGKVPHHNYKEGDWCKVVKQFYEF